MFVSDNVPALFKKGVLKMTPRDDGTYRRVAEATLVIEPFPVALAHEMGEEFAEHLVDSTGAIREELEAIDLRVRAGLQSVTVRPHEELEPIALIAPVSIKDVSVTRVEDKKSGRQWLSLSFVLVFSLEDKAVRNFVLDEFGKTLLWSFVSMQRELLQDAAIHDAAARLGELGPCTITATGMEPITFDETTAKANREKAATLRKHAADRQTH
jgi:hypothetical protein